MTKQEKYQLAKWAVQYAQHKGAQQVSVSISNSRNSSIDIRQGKIDKLEQAIESNLSIRIYADKKYSAHSTNRLDKVELSRFIEEAIAGTQYLSEDEFRTLPEPSLYYRDQGIDLKINDPEYVNHDPKEKIKRAYEIEEEVLGKDDRIISVTAGYYDGLSERVLVNSNGFEGDTANTYYGCYASVSVKGKDARPESGWSESDIYYHKLIRKGIGKTALNRALRKIGQGKVESGKMSMLVENRVVSRILNPLISALNGSAIQQKNSFLINKLGEKIFSEKLTVIDNPFLPSAIGSRLFDNEGIASKERLIVENGIITNYYIDTYYGKKLNMSPTSGSSTNLVFKTGNRDLENLISEIDKGILVTGFNGGNCNGATGDFSYGIEGLLILNGEIIKPVSEMNITGNMMGLWSGIKEIGNDEHTKSSWRTPSILFNEVDFSGA